MLGGTYKGWNACHLTSFHELLVARPIRRNEDNLCAPALINLLDKLDDVGATAYFGIVSNVLLYRCVRSTHHEPWSPTGTFAPARYACRSSRKWWVQMSSLGPTLSISDTWDIFSRSACRSKGVTHKAPYLTAREHGGPRCRAREDMRKLLLTSWGSTN